ncbi:hypothetical protein NAT51_18870 [Flavobacterium amniphilum]|uniref:hypothetical protein n=1 Tax=Flavobacterium amniphilum TaxID=1834035 RepID=UPI00202A67C5|nr:hypothetical protein [Flavobacterium amniphilum]MCL9807593.1 hypothetical protein [Flavobacterium amniphilum]
MKKTILLSAFIFIGTSVTTYAQNQFPATGTVQINNVNDNNRLLIQQTTEPTNQNLVSFITGLQRGVFFKDRPTMQGGLWLLGGGCCYPDGDVRMNGSGFIGAGVFGDGATFIPTSNQASFMRFQSGNIDFYGMNNLTPGTATYPISDGAKMTLTTSPTTQLNVNGEVRSKEITVNTTGNVYNKGLRISFTDNYYSGGAGEAYFDITNMLGGFTWRQSNVTLMRLDASKTLRLDGELRAKAIRVRSDVWADYVFAADYKLPALSDVEQFIKENKHLPNIPSEKEIVENGIDVAQMQEKHMQKIEELTLYVIELEKQNKKLQERLESIETLLNKQK